MVGDELISKEGGSYDEQTCHRREGDTHKANNQFQSYLEGWLLEQIRPNWISADYKETVALSPRLNNWDSHVSVEAHGKGALSTIAEK